MSQPQLNNTIPLYVHKDKTDQFDIITPADSFIYVNDRRNYFGNVSCIAVIIK